MIKLFIDTNIILDVLLKRSFFQKESLQLLSLTANEQYSLFISALSYINIHHQLKKHYPENECRMLLATTKQNLKTVNLTDINLEKVLISDFSDFEDAVQYHSALSINVDCIITRNKKDFKKNKIKVLNPTEFLAQITR